MTQSLPPRPSLEHLKKQAKSLLRAARQGSPEVLARFQVLTKGSPSDREPQPLQLADALRLVAHDYGFVGWSQLKEHVEDLLIAAQSEHERVDSLIRYCLDGNWTRAHRLLDRYPTLPTANIFAAAAWGEIAVVQTMLARDGSLVDNQGGPLQTTPLVYACSSRLAAPDHPREPLVRSVVELLLQHGADPNAYWINADFQNAPLPALYGACGVNGNVEISRLLLDAGANPNDNESLYHSVEHPSTECTALLLSRGANILGTNAVHNAVALGNRAAVELFLDQGTDVNLLLGSHNRLSLFHWAIETNQPRDMLEFLIARGADIRSASYDGVTPYRRAIHGGHAEAMALLADHQVAEPLRPLEQLLAACMTGDETTAIRLAAEQSLRIDDLPLEGRGLLHMAAWRGNLGAVRTLLRIGFHVDWPNHQQATALHAAAWQGHAELVHFLLAHQAAVDVHDTQFHSTPLEWGLHGSQNCRQRIAAEPALSHDAAYSEITRALLAAGSPRPVDRLVQPCQGGVLEALEAAGFVDDEMD